MSKIPVSRLHELFGYDKETGRLVRKIYHGRRRPGTFAGTVSNGKSRAEIRVDNVRCGVAEIIFAMHHGHWPNRLSHIDGDLRNTRIENLCEMFPASGEMPDVEDLHESFNVSPDGGLYWKIPNWGGIKPGDIAGSENGDGYRRVHLNGVRLPVHRVVWAMVNGRWPDEGKVIDHIDGNPSNNHPDNLREVTWQENAQNRRRPSKNNRTGTRVPGVSWNSALGQFAVNLKIDGKVRFLGSFDHLPDAEREALRLRRKHYVANTL